MTDKILLDDGSYEENLEQALRMLEEKAPWWTHRKESDPGVTLLELWSLLTDIQSGYMDQVKERHYRQYLNLAGVKPDEGEQARAWVCIGNVREKRVLPKGTKMLAGEVVFETEQAELLTDNEIIAFGPGGEVALEENYTMFRGVPRQYSFPLKKEEDGSILTVTLRRGLERGESLRVLILVQEAPGRNRPDRDTFCLARLCWEYRTGEGWERMETVADGTYGLLFSGFIILKRPCAGRSGRRKEATDFAIRCRIEEGSFDRMPVLQYVLLNAVEVCQQDTLCSTLYFTYESGMEEGKDSNAEGSRRKFWEESASAVGNCREDWERSISLFSDYAALTGEMEVFIRTEDGDWELCGGEVGRDIGREGNGTRSKNSETVSRGFEIEIRSKSSVIGSTDRDMAEGQKSCVNGSGIHALRFIGSSLEGELPQNQKVVKVVCRQPEFSLMNPPLEITGAAGQEIVLPWDRILCQSVRLQVKERADSRIFQEYECTSQESTAPFAWHWGEAPGTIRFGDGRHGRIPEASWEEGVSGEEARAGQPYLRHGLCITSLALWDGKKGNVSAGRICAFEKPEMFEGLTVSNPLPASGGRDRLTAAEQFAGLQKHLSVPHCAVTVSDYAGLALETPGLIIPEASAQAEDLKLVVKIQLPQADADSFIKETYSREVSRYLEKHRLINTDIVVEPA